MQKNNELFLQALENNSETISEALKSATKERMPLDQIANLFLSNLTDNINSNDNFMENMMLQLQLSHNRKIFTKISKVYDNLEKLFPEFSRNDMTDTMDFSLKNSLTLKSFVRKMPDSDDNLEVLMSNDETLKKEYEALKTIIREEIQIRKLTKIYEYIQTFAPDVGISDISKILGASKSTMWVICSLMDNIPDSTKSVSSVIDGNQYLKNSFNVLVQTVQISTIQRSSWVNKINEEEKSQDLQKG